MKKTFDCKKCNNQVMGSEGHCELYSVVVDKRDNAVYRHCQNYSGETVEVEVRHCLDLSREDGANYPSNATAIRLLGRAMEELDKDLLWKMGGQVGGVQEIADVRVHINAGAISVKVSLNFDAEMLRKYIDTLDRNIWHR